MSSPDSAPRISVVMPVKGADPSHVRQAVDSVLNQSMSDLELVVVEDPSDRSARNVFSGISDSRLTYLENPRPTSHAAQINKAIAMCRSEWIAHMDSDDVADPRRLELQTGTLRTHPDVDVIGG